MSELLTLKEFAKRSNVAYVTARRWSAKGVIPTIRIGGAVRVPEAYLDELIENAGRVELIGGGRADAHS